MNPLHIAEQLRSDYLELLTTTFAPRQERLKQDFRTAIEREGFLTREPFISLALPYAYGPALTELLPETRQRFGAIAGRPYAHQAAAVRRILEGQPTVIATGTGSGKTEAFLMPIIDHCLRVEQPDVVKAVIVYPMNALANDQRDRIRRLLAGTNIGFGVYTGETKQWTGQRPEGVPDNERLTRAEFRAHPPDILLTNYRMLEYLLLRGDGRAIFKNHAVRFVVLDEVHTYKGALGTDVACLLRRLRAALGDAEPIFIGTSATLESGDGDPREGVAQFFTRLTGQATPPEAVIREQPVVPQPPPGLRLPGPPALTPQDLEGFDPEAGQKVLTLARKLAGQDLATIEACWESSLLPYLLLDWMKEPRPVSWVRERLAERPERQGVAPEHLEWEIQLALLVGPCLRPDHPLRLRPRVHRFLRGLARFWRCTNPDCGKLLDSGVETCDACGSRSLPLALCRTCGWDFFIGREEDYSGGATAVVPWLSRRSSRKTTFVYDPPGATVEVEPEDLPEEGEVGEESAGEEVAPQPEAPEATHWLCPQCLVLCEDPEARACGCTTPLRPVRLLRGRGTSCPVCRSRYGRFDVITPVSLGNSSALTHVSRTLLRELPLERRKLLVFTDSRQDAAHQARFIEGAERLLRLRRFVYGALAEAPQAHDLRWLEEHIYERYVEAGEFTARCSRDERERRRRKLDGALLHEFVIAPNVRQSLERLGLVEVRYSLLDEELDGAEFEQIVREHGLDIERARLAVKRLLDLFRTRRAVSHEALRRYLRGNDTTAREYGITPGREVGVPVAFRQPGLSTEIRPTYRLLSSWNRTGMPAGPQSLWRQTLGEQATEASLDAVLHWLLDGGRFLARGQIGRNAGEAEGLLLRHEVIEVRVARTYTRCAVCGRVEANGPVGAGCARPRCTGTMQPYAGALAERNLHARLIAASYAPTLLPGEHSAAVSEEQRLRAEEGFRQTPPRPNVLVCTPTLELGVNIGDLEGVAMRNVPPSPANYAQRAGRTGRETRTGIIAGFARGTPHDGYFFDHPDEVIAGAIPPPRFNLENLAAIERHVNSLVLEEATLEFSSNLEPLLTDRGELIENNVTELIRRLEQAAPAARARAERIFGAVNGVTTAWLDSIVSAFPGRVRRAIEQRGALIAEAVRRMSELGTRVGLNRAEEITEASYRRLAQKLREDYKYAYLPTVLAEAGLLPGYAFPGDPGSLSLGLDPDVVFAGRLQAQREFCPGQTVYARGHRWRVRGLALNRPGALGTGRGPERFSFTECPVCGLAQSSNNNCRRCNAELSGANQEAWDAAAFQAWLEEVEPESEEERQQGLFDVRPHPQRDVAPEVWTLGTWRLEKRRQEQIWWINHGSLEGGTEGNGARGLDRPQPFRLCATCGELVRPPSLPEAQPQRGRRQTRDPRADQDPHAQRCNGEPREVVIGHQTRADTLRLIVPGLAQQYEDGVSWAWSVGTAILEGALKHFELDDDDLDVMVLTARDADSRPQALEIVFADKVLGGSGVIDSLLREFRSVLQAAIRHLDGHDCPASCYRCLRSYRNQRVHGLLNWRLAMPYLRVAALSALSPAQAQEGPGLMEGPDWEEARREGCESPIELALLKAIRSAGLPEPMKQHEVHDGQGRLVTRADFAYTTPRRILIYADGMEFHSSLRQRIHDGRQSNLLQAEGWLVIRFLGPQILSAPQECVAQLRAALCTPNMEEAVK
ncbi:MAG TPA: DEAD/DEAH box helicase [Bryobacteraceae bacterium]|nr:DEAD/DEAH box helicase [Bryobacteraceae bacterium]